MRRHTLIPVLLLPFLYACSDEAPQQSAAPAAPAATVPDKPAPAGQASQAPPAGQQSQTPAAPADQQAQAATGNPAAMPTAAGGAAQGEAVYKQTCSACHAAGVAGAPKLADKADWQPRIAQGMDVLYEHSIKGYQGKKGFMPPKGGNMSLSDEQVKAAVEYMVAQAK